MQARSLAIPAAAALGPIALGAVLGAPISATTALRQAAIVPAIVVGLAATTVPALYIATVATGSRLTAARLSGALGRGLEALGVVALGLVGPLAFLCATTRSPKLGVLLGAIALSIGAALGLGRMRAAMVRDAASPSATEASLFVVWGGVAAVLGARLYFDLMAIR